ncbi:MULTISPECIES: hypothetical protein [Colwellia]|uniref:Lipoprotein n=1 Tax=Colwellia marinimaniae TaxID=1513592 RepID=A0ABQ0MR28_9GAMM|nr:MULTISPECIES: hypothetical protein [Colwellia]GAW94810.1 hypothetical protein MTCD1_00407 [Colwellia marinimaniae]
MNKYLISPLLLTILLQGCGGSSSSTPPEPSEPPEPVEYNFSLTSQLSNDCGVSSAFMEIELLLQDDTWQTLKTYQPDDNGVISFITQDEFINYTIVAKNQQGDEAEGLNVVSFYQASSDTPSHYQAQFDSLSLVDNASSCECVTKDLNLVHAPLAMDRTVTSSANFDKPKPIDESNTLFEGVRVCRIIGGNWPLHSFSVEGLGGNQKLIAAGNFFDLNAEDNSGGAWSLFATLSATSYQLTLPYQELTSVQLINGEKYFATQVAEGEQSLLIFDNHLHTSESYYQSQASMTWVPSGSIFGTAVSKTKHQVISTIIEESLSVMAGVNEPAFNEPYFDEIKADGSYDYRAVAAFPMAIINFVFRTTDPETGLAMPAQWTFYGPEEGTLAISAPLTGYEDIIDIKTSKESQDVQLINSKISNTYSDYIKYYQGDSSADLTNDFVKDMTAIELALKFN